MVDREMLAAIEDLLDRKLEEKLEEKLHKKLEEKLNKKLDQKFDEKLKPINIKLDNLEISVKKLDERTSRLEASVEKLEDDMTYVKVVQLENNVIPRLSTIEKCYIDTSDRYLERAEQIDRMDMDISVLKQVVISHSEQLKKVQ